MDTAKERPSFGSRRKRSIVTGLVRAIDDIEHRRNDEGIERSEGFKHDGTVAEVVRRSPSFILVLYRWRVGRG